jgi:hypothetical protein
MRTFGFAATAPRAPSQVGGAGRQPVELPVGVTVLQEDGLPLHVAEVTQALPEGVEDR